MFGLKYRAKELAESVARLSELEASLADLRKERGALKQEVEDLRIRAKVEDEQMRHLVKMKDEKREIEFQKREAMEDRKRHEEIAKVKDGYRDKVEKSLSEQLSQMQKMYQELLARLPDVNVMVGKVAK